MTLIFDPLPTSSVRAIRAGGPDAYGLPAETLVSDGHGAPCRHCLDHVPKGRPMLVLAWRPFPKAQPYAETGPIFLCGDDCAAWQGDGVPPILATSPDYLLKAYTPQDRILYGTGRVVPAPEIATYAQDLLSDPRVAYVDVRSARNNCFQCRIRLG